MFKKGPRTDTEPDRGSMWLEKTASLQTTYDGTHTVIFVSEKLIQKAQKIAKS